MFGLGMQELLIFMVIALLVFGSSRLPSLMRNLGRSANEFKAGMREPVSDPSDKIEDDSKPQE
jgi:sec-independent protein translocase protein TatA